MVATVECVLAVALLVPGSVGQIAGVGAFALIGLFTVTLARSSDPSSGCGCWTSHAQQANPPLHRLLLLSRNGALAALALAGTLGSAQAPQVALATAAVAGALAALILMEIPEIVSVVTTERK